MEVPHDQEGALHEVDVVFSLNAWIDVVLNLVVVWYLQNKDVTSEHAHNEVDHIGTCNCENQDHLQIDPHLERPHFLLKLLKDEQVLVSHEQQGLKLP